MDSEVIWIAEDMHTPMQQSLARGRGLQRPDLLQIQQ